MIISAPSTHVGIRMAGGMKNIEILIRQMRDVVVVVVTVTTMILSQDLVYSTRCRHTMPCEVIDLL